MIVDYTTGFDRLYQRLDPLLQKRTTETISRFLRGLESGDFPKGLRAHKCGPVISLSIDMNHRIYLRPIIGGVQCVFVGTHRDADLYLKKI